MKKLLGLFAVAPLTLAACTVKEAATTPEVEEGFDFENTLFTELTADVKVDNVVVFTEIWDANVGGWNTPGKLYDAEGNDLGETFAGSSNYNYVNHANQQDQSIEQGYWYKLTNVTYSGTGASQNIAFDMAPVKIDYTLPTA